MKFRPLWMEKFLPTNSGTMVQARDHVLIGSRLPVLSARYTFSSSRSVTYGPFFNERPMSLGSQAPSGALAMEGGSTSERDSRSPGPGRRGRAGGTSDLQLAE